jgi:hypothetical protein
MRRFTGSKAELAAETMALYQFFRHRELAISQACVVMLGAMVDLLPTLSSEDQATLCEMLHRLPISDA